MSTTIADLLIKIGVSVDGAKKAEDAINGVTGAAEDTDKKGGAGLKRFASSAKQALGNIGTSASSASESLLRIAKAAAALTVAKEAISFVGDQMERLDEIAKTSATLALSTDEYQRLTQAAEHLGTSTEDLGAGIRKINADMLTVGTDGGQEFQARLAAIGLTFQDLDGKSTTEKLGLIGDALNLIEDPAIRAARSAQIFGEDAGPKLANVLAAGTAGLTELSAAAEGVFTREQLADAEAFQDAMTDVKRVLGGVAGDLAVMLAPALQSAAEGIGEFIKNNQDFIDQALPEILGAVLEVGEALVPIVVQLGESIANVFANSEELVPSLTALVGTIADIIAQMLPFVESVAVFLTGELSSAIGFVDDALTQLKPSIAVLMDIGDSLLDIAKAGADVVHALGPVADTLLFLTTGAIELGLKGISFVLEGVASLAAKLAESFQWIADSIAEIVPFMGEDGNLAGAVLAGLPPKPAAVEEVANEAPKTAPAAASQRATQMQLLAERTAREQARLLQREAEKSGRGKGGGRGKAKPAAEKVGAHFGDYRDVLATYPGRAPDEQMRALEQLEKGTMPKDHRPETSINITNNTTNNVEATITVEGAGDPKAVAKAVETQLRESYKRVAASTPATMVR